MKVEMLTSGEGRLTGLQVTPENAEEWGRLRRVAAVRISIAGGVGASLALRLVDDVPFVPEPEPAVPAKPHVTKKTGRKK
jgi:hypothetical protein